MAATGGPCALLPHYTPSVGSQGHVTLTFNKTPAFSNSQLKLSCNFPRCALLTAVTIFALSGTRQEGSLLCSIEEGGTVGTGVLLTSNFEGCPTFHPLSGHVNVTLQAYPELALNYSCLVSFFEHETFYTMMSDLTRLEIKDITDLREYSPVVDPDPKRFILDYNASENERHLKEVMDLPRNVSMTTGAAIVWSVSTISWSPIYIIIFIFVILVLVGFQKRKREAIDFDTRHAAEKRDIHKSTYMHAELPITQEHYAGQGTSHYETTRRRGYDQYDTTIGITIEDHEYTALLG